MPDACIKTLEIYLQFFKYRNLISKVTEMMYEQVGICWN